MSSTILSVLYTKNFFITFLILAMICIIFLENLNRLAQLHIVITVFKNLVTTKFKLFNCLKLWDLYWYFFETSSFLGAIHECDAMACISRDFLQQYPIPCKTIPGVERILRPLVFGLVNDGMQIYAAVIKQGKPITNFAMVPVNNRTFLKIKFNDQSPEKSFNV